MQSQRAIVRGRIEKDISLHYTDYQSKGIPTKWQNFDFTEEALVTIRHLTKQQRDRLWVVFAESLKAGADPDYINNFLVRNRDFFINELFEKEDNNDRNMNGTSPKLHDFFFSEEALVTLSYAPKDKKECLLQYLKESLEAGADMDDINDFLVRERDFFINEIFAEEDYIDNHPNSMMQNRRSIDFANDASNYYIRNERSLTSRIRRSHVTRCGRRRYQRLSHSRTRIRR